ncbi:LppU/SCO3897 family protein [Yinghuangia sp. YIM S09857]|uniref:LppU/SCO3897 family protein n=1 Tax=Yinghuangia sp. YIM S09857 TaxID=3436929 RepID=UPI003F5303DC
MSNYPSASDPDEVPYVPVWLDSTPAQGSSLPVRSSASAHSSGPASAPDGGRRGRRGAARERSVLLSPLVMGLTLLLLVVVGGGAYLYFQEGEKRAYSEGSCLDDLAGSTPHVAECGTPEAKYKIISIIPDTIDGTQCGSVTGANIPIVVDRKDLLCIMDIGR